MSSNVTQIRSRLRTRKPTGKPSWPMLLLAGGEKCGKSYAAAAFSASPLIGRTFYLEVGEGSADQYGALPGARYEVIEHDGTYPGMLEQIEAAVAEPFEPGRPNVIVVDSMTELWDLLVAEQEDITRKRNKEVITMDQWNSAKRRWRRFVDAARKNAGPVIFTARFEQVTVVEGGKPKTVDGTKNGAPVKEWKIRAEKNLPFEVDGIIQMPSPRKYVLTGMRTLVFDIPPGGHFSLPDDFTLHLFMQKLGLSSETTGAKSYTAPTTDAAYVEQQAADAKAALDADLAGKSAEPGEGV